MLIIAQVILLITYIFFIIPQSILAVNIKSNSWSTEVGDSEDPDPLQGQLGEFVYYCQGNPEWAGRCVMGGAGCGPTSLAMILSTFRVDCGGQTCTPPVVDQQFNNRGYRACADVGSNMIAAVNSSWVKSLGMDVSPDLTGGTGRLDLQAAKKALDDGYYIAASSQKYPCANCRTPGARIGHIFVVDQVDVVTRNVRIRDPNNCSYSNGNDENTSNLMKSVDAFPWYYAYALKRVGDVVSTPGGNAQ